MSTSGQVLWSLLLVSQHLLSLTQITTVWDFLESRDDLKEFRRMVSSVENGRLVIQLQEKDSSKIQDFKKVVFAPTDQAISLARQEVFATLDDPSLVKYHLSDQAGLRLTSGQCPQYHLRMMNHNQAYVSSYLDEFQNEFAEKKRYCFINNARVMFEAFEAAGKHITTNGYVYIIDRVLAPTADPRSIIQYLEQGKNFKYMQELFDILRTEDVGKYREIANAVNGTMFIPVDEAFDNIEHRHKAKLDYLKDRPNKLFDFLLSHLTIRNTYFLRALGPNKDRPMGRGVVEYSYDKTAETSFIIVNTVRVNLAGKAKDLNRPMKNGVVHVISKLLWPFDDVMEVMKQSEHSTEFQTLLANDAANISHQLFWTDLESPPNDQFLTILAPDNEAVSRAMGVKLPFFGLDPELYSANTLNITLRQHIIRQRMSYADIKTDVWNLPPAAQREAAKCKRHPTLAGSPYPVCFYKISNETFVWGDNTLALLIPEWSNEGGVNGLIHSIDTVLGAPWRPIGEQLKVLPILKQTMALMNRYAFLQHQAMDAREHPVNVTVFAPIDEFWTRFKEDNGTAGFFDDVATMNRVLRRHMHHGYKKVVLKNHARIPTMNYHEYLYVRPVGDSYEILFRNQRYQVLYPNIGAYNGIIHIIDRAMLIDDDFNSEMTSYGHGLSTQILLLYYGSYLLINSLFL